MSSSAEECPRPWRVSENRKVSSSVSKRERTVLRPSTCTTANGIHRLEADDMMELRVLRHSLELSTQVAR